MLLGHPQKPAWMWHSKSLEMKPFSFSTAERGGLSLGGSLKSLYGLVKPELSSVRATDLMGSCQVLESRELPGNDLSCMLPQVARLGYICLLSVLTVLFYGSFSVSGSAKLRDPSHQEGRMAEHSRN